MAMERLGASTRKEWRAQRSPIPIRARDVRERRQGALSMSCGAVEHEVPAGYAFNASAKFSSDLDVRAMPPQCVASHEESCKSAARETRASLNHLASALASKVSGAANSKKAEKSLPTKKDHELISSHILSTETDQGVATPRRRQDGHELSEERKRLGFGETPFKQMPAISPLESGRRRAALDTSLQSPTTHDRISHPMPVEDLNLLDSRPPVKFLEDELGSAEVPASSAPLASHVPEARISDRRNKRLSHSKSPRPFPIRADAMTQPMQTRFSNQSKVSAQRCPRACSVRRSSPIGRVRCTKTDGNSLRSSPQAACGGA